MNLAIRGIDGQIAHGDTFHNDRHPDLRADTVLANSPFNISDWGGERLRDDKRWQYEPRGWWQGRYDYAILGVRACTD
jgi:type I restriction enzyme M protein